MKVKLVQMNSVQNQIETNLDFVLNQIEIARGTCDVIVFPELCLSSTMAMDNFENQYFINDLLDANQKIVQASSGIRVIWGNVDQQQGLLINCGYVAYNQAIVFQINKMFSATSTLSSIKQYFVNTPQETAKTFMIDDTICSLFINHDMRVFNHNKVDVIFHLDSHYYRAQDDQQTFLNYELREDQVLVSVNGVNIVNNGKHIAINDGGSFVMKNGIRELLNQEFQVESRLIDTNQIVPTPLKNNRLFLSLVAMIREMDQQLFPFKPQWIVGVSGGLDSSVTIALLSYALGNKRVLGANLSTKHNSDRTKNNARFITQKLGVQLVETSIESLVNETLSSMNDCGFNQVEGLAYENIQARLRGHLLSTLSSLNNGLVSNNTNKIESALGYGTLYGDTIGAIGFLADCTKMDVVKLAVEINKVYDQEIVPKNLIPVETEKGLAWDFMPSAELAYNQTDPMKWGYHDYLVSRLLKGHSQLEEILMDYKNKGLQTSEIGKYIKTYGLEDPKDFIDDLLWVIKNMNRNVFKRIQGAPTLVVSNKVIGLDNHETQGPLVLSSKAKQLIKEIENV